VAKVISDKVFAINSEQRKALHVAAVFVNNFTNHLYTIEMKCQENRSFDIFKTDSGNSSKNMTISPKDSNTAKRMDLKIEAHHYFIGQNQSTIYKIITQSIQDNGKKL
jgi:hypothetical protein